ncbi:MAG: EAL domain-containing protein [Acidobacteria bacterium]|nr:EAL domain-containing protein [Acidobacteriota bacterium]
MSETVDQIHVARQPILDAANRVFGYELLYRAAATDTACVTSVDQASARVIADAMLGIGFDVLADGRRAFINLSSDTLLADASSVFDPAQVVLEVLEDVEATPDVVKMCRSLHQRGYAIALDDFVPDSSATALLPYASFVKLDVLALQPAHVAAITPRLIERGLSVIAEKVETAHVFDQARAAGCSLFQGYYFCRPVTFSGQTLSASQVAQLRLLAALYKPTVSLPEVEDLLKHDGSLTYRVLRTVNSAGFGLRREVRSIREALLLLGLDQVRKWTSVWVLAGANRGPSELVTMTVLRGRTCELLGRALGHADEGSGYFLLGLCSMLDSILGQPMARIVQELPIEAEIQSALLGKANVPRRVLDAVVLYEQGGFSQAGARTRALGLDEGTLPAAYADALKWSHELNRNGTKAA